MKASEMAKEILRAIELLGDHDIYCKVDGMTLPCDIIKYNPAYLDDRPEKHGGGDIFPIYSLESSWDDPIGN
jgi:hypothetical protein